MPWERSQRGTPDNPSAAATPNSPRRRELDYYEINGRWQELDIVVEGTTPGAKRRQAAAEVHKWSQSGATWWLEALWSAFDKEDGPASVHKRITQGPPR